MKKSSFVLICLLVTCLVLTGCGGAAGTAEKQDNPTAQESVETDNSAVQDSDSTAEASESSDSAELKDPVMDWWELYNPNGFDTFTAEVTNPNDTPVDISFDMVFYKDGAEIARGEGWAAFSILPGQKTLIWDNFNTPPASDVDEVKMENIYVSEAYETPISGKCEFVKEQDDELYFDYEFESQPALGTIYFLLYRDDNENGSFDKGEIVVTAIQSVVDQKGEIVIDAADSYYPFTDYEIFLSAY